MATATAATPIDRLRTILAEVSDILSAEQLLDWDSRVSMPHRGAAARADASATLTRLAHERFIADDVGELLEELGSADLDGTDAALLRVTRREWERAIRIPPELAAEMSHTGGIAVAAWDEAKAASDFASFAPHLEKQLALKHRYIDCFPPTDTPYDVLLDEYEEGMTTAEVAAVFATLKEALVPLVEEVRVHDDDPFIHGPFPIAAQREAGLKILQAFGYSDEEWRLDETPHPFASKPGFGDIRLTTHYETTDLHSLFSTMHEFGHGVYEWGVDPALARTPLGNGTSSAFHESQSRTWENLVGRSRGFWRWFYPQLQPLLPEALGDVDEDRFFRGVNAVRPDLIRIDADEVTYALHIILRFELEQDLLAGNVAINDLPDVWNTRMREYLGVEVPNDARGVLQDMHWAAGLFGYFPTYQLGNVISVQIWRRAEQELGDLEERFARGEFAPLREWLREQVYQYGSIYPPRELLQRVTGSDLDPQPYLEYLRAKFGS
jgi:carboxypeptidase Taq